MEPEFNLYIKPPPADIVERARARIEKLFPLVVLGFFVSIILCFIVYAKLWGNYPDWQFMIECALLLAAIVPSLLLWKLTKIVSSGSKLAEAHPVTAHAYIACANSESVKSYCRSVIQQGRNLTMEEAGMLLKHCTTPEEIARLDEYYEKHAPLPIYGGYGWH